MESTTACKCKAEVPLSTHFDYANVVFIGKAIKVTVDEPNFKSKAIFYVHDIFKGKCSAEKITITTATDRSACGFRIKRGEKWQIWAQKSGDHFQANHCGKSTKSIYDNIDFLRQQNCLNTTSS
jgi:hypothetical protein